MSCGSPHATNCRDVLEEVYLYLDGEVDNDRRSLIREHLDECSPCLRQFGVEQEVKILVARCCGSERAPDTLRVSVMQRIQVARAEWAATEFRAD